MNLKNSLTQFQIILQQQKVFVMKKLKSTKAAAATSHDKVTKENEISLNIPGS